MLQHWQLQLDITHRWVRTSLTQYRYSFGIAILEIYIKMAGYVWAVLVTQLDTMKMNHCLSVLCFYLSNVIFNLNI